jgi:hypothetical protein
VDRHGRTWLDRLAVEQGDEADEAFGGMVARMDMPPHARAGQIGRGHRFAAYPRCSTDLWEGEVRLWPGWSLAGLVLLASCGAVREDELPKVADGHRPTPKASEFAVALDAAAARYVRGIECGTQYLLEMADLAGQADEHLPELTAAFRAGKADSEATTILRLMQSRALLAVPGLMELADDPDPAVRTRALAALEVVFEAAEPATTTCSTGSAPVRRGSRTRG